MMREAKQLDDILNIIGLYDHKMPLHHFLKKYFRLRKQMGSRDRKQAADWVYHYFRLRHAFNKADVKKALVLSHFICDKEITSLLRYGLEGFPLIKPEDVQKPIEDKLKIISQFDHSFNSENIFPFRGLLSGKIDENAFLNSFLYQPKVWIRIGGQYRKNVLDELNKTGIIYKEHKSGAVGFSGKTKLEGLASWEKGYFEIQDIASQHCCSLFQSIGNDNWWDACAASGGKSIALLDRIHSVKLTVSDIRPSILENLKERFEKINKKDVTIVLHDAASGKLIEQGKMFDAIIADVPCSGSGTWSRTPERLSSFNEAEIEKYRVLQEKMVSNALRQLEPGGLMYYFTCSVFKAENEELIEAILNTRKAELKQMEYWQFSNEGGDTMFAAILKKV
jgi:16S rRNA (cytosine967-C5)-methyltransferase